MPLIYIPRTIETVEEAEGMATGTVALNDGWMARKVQDGGWAMIWPPGAHTTMRSVIAWSALVPVEAEEERDYWPDFSQSPPDQTIVTRLTTLWREA